MKNYWPLPHEGKAMAILEAIHWGLEMNINVQVCNIETGYQRVVTSIHSQTLNEIEYGSIIHQCRSLLSNLPNYHVSFVRRQANLVAHSFVRASKLLVGPHWYIHILACIFQQILNEMK